MRRVLVLSFLAAVVLSLGCAVTNYPLIYDTRGADANVLLQSFYDLAYIVPTSQVSTIYPDGADELYTEVSQNWTGDQRLKTYDNFDPSAMGLTLDQTYCNPTTWNNTCVIYFAQNPNLPDYDPTLGPPPGPNGTFDDIFDGTLDTTCTGARSLSMLQSVDTRVGECGSGIFADKQAAAYEFSTLDQVTFRGKSYYHLPIDGSMATFALTAADGTNSTMPVFGRFNGYVDDRFRMVLPVTPNAKYQLRWISNWVNTHGSAIDANVTYGSLNTNFKLNVTAVNNALDRL